MCHKMLILLILLLFSLSPVYSKNNNTSGFKKNIYLNEFYTEIVYENGHFWLYVYDVDGVLIEKIPLDE